MRCLMTNSMSTMPRSKHPQARQTQLMVCPVKPNLLTPALPAKTVPIVWMLILASTRNAVTAQQGVADFVARAVKIVVISGIDYRRQPELEPDVDQCA